MCLWVRAMYKYHFINKAVEPKREALKIAQAELESTQAALASAKRKLKDTEMGLIAMQRKHTECVKKKEDLEVNMKECEARLIRADRVQCSQMLCS